MLNSFLALSGDNNPLHADRHYAKEKGFKDRVVYGMLISAFYSRLVGVYLPGKNALLQGIEINFHNPVYVGDILAISGEVSYINEAYKQIEIIGYIRNQENKLISKANIKVGLNE
jgi:3-hydroxybutyryl-CoA dehydratase